MNRNKRITYARLVAAVVTVLSIYLFAPWKYGLYYLRPLPTSVQQELDHVTQQGIDGVIVYIDQKGQPPQSFVSGTDNRVTASPVRPDALFKIASIAKLYEAAAVTKLVGEGKLSLDASLSYYLPFTKGRIENAEKITIRHLVQHRSGIPNFTDHERFHWGELDIDVMDLVLDQPADFAPGTDYAYSNSNYLLLSQIISAVTGAPHGDYIKQTILQPLGLTRTFFSIHEVDKDKIMSGYHLGYDEDLRHLDHGYLSSAKDVAIFVRALNKGTFFTEQEQQIYASLYKYGHSGWVLGYQSIARYHAKEDLVVIQFVSTTGDDLVLMTKILYDRVMEIIRAK